MAAIENLFSAQHLWWLFALLLGILELFTGTFYLLVIALGLCAGGLAAWLGAAFAQQLLVTAVVSVLGAALVHRLRSLAPKSLSPDQNPDLNLDIGQLVRVEQWQPDGSTRLHYRGAPWSARLKPGHAAVAGAYRIDAIQGSQLILVPASGQDASRV